MAFNVDGLRKQLQRQVNDFAGRAADGITAEVREAAPVETGVLKRSVTHTTPQVSDSQVSFTVQTGDLIQANTTEYGARPHVIVPRTKRALAFRTNGTLVITKRVNHPGNKPDPWFYPTVNKWPEVAGKVWRRVSR